MYVKIIDNMQEEEVFNEIKNLKFKAETDVTGNTIPIGSFSVDIRIIASSTDMDYMKIGFEIGLFDEDDNVYCWFMISDVKQLSNKYVRVEAQSVMAALDKLELDPVLYGSVSFESAVWTIFHKLRWFQNGYILDPELISQSQNYQVHGYWPKQTARQRLQQMCYTVGVYVKQYFCSKISFLLVPSTAVMIPENKIFWRPQINYDDFVTSVKVTAYTYTQGTPGPGDESVVDQHGDTYIVTKQDYTLSNPDTPTWVLDNELTLDLKCVTEDNISDVLSKLALFYFSRMRVSADILNNGEYLPGIKYTMSTGFGMASGWMESADFVFGTGNKSKIEIGSAAEVDSGNLIIQCQDEGENVLKEFKYTLPVGYSYSIQNVYLDLMRNKHRYIYYPDQEYATGTVGQGETIDEELYHVALDWYKKRLKIISVDEASSSEGIVSIA